MDNTIIGWDTETHLIAPGMLSPKGVVLSWSDGPGSDLVLFPEACDWFEKQLRSDSILVAHNSAYDLAVVAAERPELLPLIFQALADHRLRDTMVAGKLIDIARGEHKLRRREDGTMIRSDHSLAGMARLYLDLVLQKTDTYRLRYNELDGLPLQEWPEEAKHYALEDARIVREVYLAQMAYVAKDGLFTNGKLPNEAEQTRAAFMLHLMAVWGVRTDGASVRALRQRLEKQLEGSHDFLASVGLIHQTGSKKNPKWTKDTKAIQAKIQAGFEKLGERPPLTDTGRISTADEAKYGCGDPDLIKMASFTTAEHLLDTYVPLLEKGAVYPINARWNVLVESGRTSCQNPNLQNPPAADSSVRECFVPRPGFVYGGADYSVIELRALGQICLDLFGHSNLVDVFRAGGDPHTNLAIQMGLPADKNAMVEINGKPIEVRKYCKLINFGFASGLGPDTFVSHAKRFGVDLTTQQATDARSAWFTAWPEVRSYFQRIGNQIPHDTATVIQLRSGRIRGSCRFTQAVNTQFQGLVADMVKEALWLISREAYTDPKSVLWGSRPVLLLHDELILEIPIERATPAADRMVALMLVGAAKWMPDVPAVVPDPVLMSKWSKKAKSVRSSNGELSIWTGE